MITYIKGDIFNSPSQVLVNPVNTIGVMGKGIALGFKNKYPGMYDLYKEKCNEGSFKIGNLLLYKDSNKWILLFPTKAHWRDNSKLSYIEEGLKKFVEFYDKLGIESIAFPKLGCGNGGLKWSDVKPLMEKYLKNLPIHVYVYLENHQEGKKSIKEALEIDKWLRNNTELIGFNFLKKELQGAILNKGEILLEDSSIKQISWTDEEIIISNGENIVIDESQLCDFWKYIKNVGIFNKKNLPTRFLKYGPIMIEILNKLDYIQPILIMNNSLNEESNKGYQYISS